MNISLGKISRKQNKTDCGQKTNQKVSTFHSRLTALTLQEILGLCPTFICEKKKMWGDVLPVNIEVTNFTSIGERSNHLCDKVSINDQCWWYLEKLICI